MHKSYKRKNARNKTRKKYNKVGGEDGPISEQKIASQITEIKTKITSLYNAMPIQIGYFISRSDKKTPLWVRKDIDLKTFLEVINNNGSQLIDLKAVYSLPNVREIPSHVARRMLFIDDEDKQEFAYGQPNVEKMQTKYNNLIF